MNIVIYLSDMKTKKRKILPGIILRNTLYLLFLLPAGCSGPEQQPDKVIDRPAKSEKNTAFFKDEAGLLQAWNQLQQQLPAQQLYVFGDVHFYREGRIVLDLIDTTRPWVASRYEYRDGGWTSGGFLQVDIQKPYCRHITPLRDIRFTLVAPICDVWQQKAGNQDGKAAEPDNIYFSLWMDDQDRCWYTAPLDSGMVKYQLIFNKDGSFREYREI